MTSWPHRCSRGSNDVVKRALLVVATIGVAAVPGVALAQQQRPEVYIGILPTTTTVVGSPTTTTISDPATTTTLGQEVKGQVETQPTQVDPGTSLPVTGGDVLGLTAIGAGLVAIGAGFTRARRRSTQG